ncbi:CHAT domain-containing protein [Mycena capillaripes]|nr:CHAT domain-containing protein [Mycena capillaripes]
MVETDTETARIPSNNSGGALVSGYHLKTFGTGKIDAKSEECGKFSALGSGTADHETDMDSKSDESQDSEDSDWGNPDITARIQQLIPQTGPGLPDIPGDYELLGAHFLQRYRKSGHLKSLEAAVKHFQEAVHLTPPEHPDRAERLLSLGVSLTEREQRFGDVKDLEATLQARQEAVDLTPAGHPDRAGRLQHLAVSLRDQYRRFGDVKDLEAALQIDQEVIQLTPSGHPDRAGRLQSLAVSLTDRYQRFGDVRDLEAALRVDQEVIQLTPPWHPDHADRLQSLAVSLTDRYQRFGDVKDLQTALQVGQEVIQRTPPGHPDQADRLQNLSISLTDRYRRFGDVKDLEASLQTRQEAVDLTPAGHPDRAGRLQKLAVSLTDRYQKFGDVKDLEAALQADQEAVELTPPGHPDRAGRLQGLARTLTYRYQIIQDPKDLKDIHTHYTNSFIHPTLTPEASWEEALFWAGFAEQFQQSDCIPAFEAAFHLIPEILWMSHSVRVRHDAIYRLDLQDATSTAVRTCIDLSDLLAAVKILEQGLATIFQQMLQLKTNVDGLPPAQATQFLDLSSQLYSGTFNTLIGVVADRNKLLKDIRKQPGFEHFLLPKSYDVLRYASRGGPVVILSSHKDHCDAIVLLNPTSDPVHVPLPMVRLELLKSQRALLKELLGQCNVRNREQSLSSRLFGQREQFSNKSTQDSFQDMLHWLWTNVVSIVYEVLASHDISNGRLWWLPAGEFTGLPLHACSPTDEFIHSYTPTLGALLDAYAKQPSSTPPKLIVVGVTHTDSSGRNSLKGVEPEVKRILCIVKQSGVQCLMGKHATVDAVKLQLQDCSWVHLACHGHQDLIDPTKSHLQLYEGTLELETILRMPLSNAQFVFLAACQTAKGDAALVNESFHLGGGFIAAGFRSAIGTMWAMNDEDGPIVAEIVYSHLFRKGQQPQASEAAEALHLAIKELKKRRVSYERWVPFIHIGV